MFLGRSKFREQLLKRVTQGTFLWNYFQIGLAVSEERIFKELLKKFNFVAMATRVFDGIKFCGHFLKRTSQGTFLPSLVQIGPALWRRRCLKKLLTTHHRRRTHHPIEHVVLRWAKKLLVNTNVEIVPFKLNLTFKTLKKTRGPWWPWIAHLSHFSHNWILHICSFGYNLWPSGWG